MDSLLHLVQECELEANQRFPLEPSLERNLRRRHSSQTENILGNNNNPINKNSQDYKNQVLNTAQGGDLEGLLNQLSARFSSIHHEAIDDNFSMIELSRNNQIPSSCPRTGLHQGTQLFEKNLEELRYPSDQNSISDRLNQQVAEHFRESFKGQWIGLNEVQNYPQSPKISSNGQKAPKLSPSLSVPKDLRKKNRGWSLVRDGKKLATAQLSPLKTDRVVPNTRNQGNGGYITPEVSRSNPTFKIMSKHEPTGYESNLSFTETELCVQNRFKKNLAENQFPTPAKHQTPRNNEQEFIDKFGVLSPSEKQAQEAAMGFAKEYSPKNLFIGQDEKVQRERVEEGIEQKRKRYETPQKPLEPEFDLAEQQAEVQSSPITGPTNSQGLFSGKKNEEIEMNNEPEGAVEEEFEQKVQKIEEKSDFSKNVSKESSWLETITERLLSNHKDHSRHQKELIAESNKDTPIQIHNYRNDEQIQPNSSKKQQKGSMESRIRSKSAENYFSQKSKKQRKNEREGQKDRIYPQFEAARSSNRLANSNSGSNQALSETPVHQKNSIKNFKISPSRGTKVEVKHRPRASSPQPYNPYGKVSLSGSPNKNKNQNPKRFSIKDDSPGASKGDVKSQNQTRRSKSTFSSLNRLESIIANLKSISKAWMLRNRKSSQGSPELETRPKTAERVPKNRPGKHYNLDYVLLKQKRSKSHLSKINLSLEPDKQAGTNTSGRGLQKVKFFEKNQKFRKSKKLNELSLLRSSIAKNSTRLSIPQRLTLSPQKSYTYQAKILKNSKIEKIQKKKKNTKSVNKISRIKSAVMKREVSKGSKTGKKVLVSSPRLYSPKEKSSTSKSKRRLKGHLNQKKVRTTPDGEVNIAKMSNYRSKIPKMKNFKKSQNRVKISMRSSKMPSRDPQQPRKSKEGSITHRKSPYFVSPKLSKKYSQKRKLQLKRPYMDVGGELKSMNTTPKPQLSKPKNSNFEPKKSKKRVGWTSPQGRARFEKATRRRNMVSLTVRQSKNHSKLE